MKKHPFAAEFHRGMKICYPANGWREGLPLGNGSLGALVYGRLAREVILLNHERLWSGGKTLPVPDISRRLPELRQLFLEKRYIEADRFYTHLLKEAGYQAKVASYQPGPDLIIEEEQECGFSHYSRRLDFETGEATITWREENVEWERRAFVSRPDSMLVVRLCGNAGHVRKRKIRLREHCDSRDPIGSDVKTESAVSDGMAAFWCRIGGDCSYGAAMRVIAPGSRIIPCRDEMEIVGDGDVTLMISLAPFLQDIGEVGPLAQRLEACTQDYPSLLGRHVPGHKKLFQSMVLDLKCSREERQTSNEKLLLEAYAGRMGRALVEKIHDFGRYLLISSSRPGGLPAHLQGLWNGDHAPAWCSAYFNNENIQISYWQALPGNLAEAVLPVFDLYETLLPDFRENARKFFGCRGILLPLYLSPDCGLQKDLQSHVLYWTGGGAWLSQMYFDYWMHTRDLDFLNKRAFPFMREAAGFYEDFLVEDESGRLNIFPGNSPENCPIGDNWKTGDVRACMNATMDFALVKELFSNLVSAGKALGLAEHQTGKWRRMLEKIPPYQVNEDGALREWMHPDFKDNYYHRHLSHLYPLFPAHEITRETEPGLFQAGIKALEKRLAVGLGEQCGWSFAHMANIHARTGNGERALECLGLLARSCLGANLLTYISDCRDMGISMRLAPEQPPPMQVDSNFGCTAAILEMLVYSMPGYLRILPALPRDWQHGEVRGIQGRGGISIDLSWNTKIGSLDARLKATSDGTWKIVTPAGFVLQDAHKPGRAAAHSDPITVEVCLVKNTVASLKFMSGT